MRNVYQFALQRAQRPLLAASDRQQSRSRVASMWTALSRWSMDCPSLRKQCSLTLRHRHWDEW